MINFKHALIVIILVSVFSGCIRQPAPSETSIPTVTPTATTMVETPGISTELKASLNKEFTISLESNPTTGYSWIAEADGDFLNLTNHTYVPDNPDQPGQPLIVGSGGKEYFTFVPVKTGETNLTMLYKRPWEKDAIEERLFRIIITK